MYAVFEDGSRQYRVSEGDVIQVDYREAEIGSRVEFDRVLLYQGGQDTHIGQPIVEGARVLADVVDHPTRKLYIQHFRRRKNYRRLRGHRQPYTAVQIRHILLPGMEPPRPSPTDAPAGPMENTTASSDQTPASATSPASSPPQATQNPPPAAPEASSPPPEPGSTASGPPTGGSGETT
jgi:large subunit ribosomal protein L21